MGKESPSHRAGNSAGRLVSPAHQLPDTDLQQRAGIGPLQGIAGSGGSFLPVEKLSGSPAHPSLAARPGAQSCALVFSGLLAKRAFRQPMAWPGYQWRSAEDFAAAADDPNRTLASGQEISPDVDDTGSQRTQYSARKVGPAPTLRHGTGVGNVARQKWQNHHFAWLFSILRGT